MRSEVQEPSDKRRKALWVISGITLVLLILAGIAVAAIDVLHLHFGYAKAAQRYRDAGMPWTLAELRGEPLPAEQNAAPALVKLAMDPAVTKSLEFPKSVGLWSRKEAALAAQGLAPRNRLLDQLKPLESLDCQWETDLDLGMDAVFPELAGMKSLVKALALRMELRSSRGDLKGSLDDLRLGLNLAGKASQGETLIHQLVCIAQRAILFNQARRAASYHVDDPKALEAFAAVMSSAKSRPRMAQGLRGEAYFGLSALRNNTAFQLLRDLQGLNAIDGEEARPRRDPVTLVRDGDPRWWLNRSLAVPYLKAWAEAGEIIKAKGEGVEAVSEVGRLLQEKADKAKGLGSLFIEILFPVFSQSAEAVKKTVVDEDSTIAALRLAALKGRQGSVSPEDIKRLTPSDPFTGKPMGVKVTDQGVSVWSFGPDGKDDGGVVKADSDTLAVNAGKPLESHHYDFSSQIPWKPTKSVLKRAAGSP